MFTNFFGSVVVQEDVKKSISDATLKSKTNTVIGLLQTNNINVNNFYLNDEYGQNLLHLCARTKNYELARYLIEKKIDKQKKNMFNETPHDIALQNRDLKMIEVLLETDNNSYVKVENKRLHDKVTELELNGKTFMNTNKELTLKNSVLHMQIETEKKSLKRIRDDNEIISFENKRLKTENQQLKSDNKILETTVKTLRDSMKKT